MAHSLPPLQLKLPLTWPKTSWRLHLTQEFWEEKFGFAVHGWIRLQNRANNTNHKEVKSLHKEAWASAEAFQLWFCFNPRKGCKVFSSYKFSIHKARIRCSFSVCEHTYWCSELDGTTMVITETISRPKSVSGLEALEAMLASMLASNSAFPLCLRVPRACVGFYWFVPLDCLL